MNKIYKKLNLAIATLAVSLLFAVPAFAGSDTTMVSMPMNGGTTQYSAQDKTIVVTGWGKSKAKVDQAVITFSLQSEGKTANESINKALEEVAAKLAPYGVKKEDIVTTWWNFFPQFDYSTNPLGVVTGFSTSRSMTVSLGSNLSNAQQAIIDLYSIKSARLQDAYLNFGVKDPSPYLVMAKESALNDAKDKAQGLANLLGVKVDSIVKVEDYTYSPMIATTQNMESVDVETSLNVTFKVK